MLPVKPAQRFFFADLLRALSIFAVIILHNATDYDAQYGAIPASYWWSGAIWNGLVRFCVPMFVVLSGALLLRPGKNITIIEIYKRLSKIIVPLICWSVIYVLFEASNEDEGIAGINIHETLKTFYNGPVIYHFWFLYMMIGIYLAYPVINLFITAAKQKHIAYFLVLWFFTNFILGLITIAYGIKPGIELNIFMGYSGYFVLGYYLITFPLSKRQLMMAYLLGIAGLIISAFMPYLCIQLHVLNRNQFIESDFTPDVLFSVIGLFLWFKNRSYNTKNTSIQHKLISRISQDSFGIYLVHVLIMELLFSEDRSYFDVVEKWHPGWGIPVRAFLVFMASFIFIVTLKRVPLLRRLAG